MLKEKMTPDKTVAACSSVIGYGDECRLILVRTSDDVIFC